METEKKNPSGLWDGAAGPGSTMLALGGMEFLFPTLGFGAGAKPVLPAWHGAFPFPTLLPARMRPWKAGKGIIPDS